MVPKKRPTAYTQKTKIFQWTCLHIQECSPSQYLDWRNSGKLVEVVPAVSMTRLCSAVAVIRCGALTSGNMGKNPPDWAQKSQYLSFSSSEKLRPLKVLAFTSSLTVSSPNKSNSTIPSGWEDEKFGYVFTLCPQKLHTSHTTGPSGKTWSATPGKAEQSWQITFVQLGCRFAWLR